MFYTEILIYYGSWPSKCILIWGKISHKNWATLSCNFCRILQSCSGETLYQAACLSPVSWVEYEVFPNEISRMVLWLVMQYVDNIWTKSLWAEHGHCKGKILFASCNCEEYLRVSRDGGVIAWKKKSLQAVLHIWQQRVDLYLVPLLKSQGAGCWSLETFY